MRNLRKTMLRQLVRSFRATTTSDLHADQTIIIVFLGTVVWMLWAMLRFGTLPAFFLTLPTALPALLWLDRRRMWIDRRDLRTERCICGRSYR